MDTNTSNLKKTIERLRAPVSVSTEGKQVMDAESCGCTKDDTRFASFERVGYHTRSSF